MISDSDLKFNSRRQLTNWLVPSIFLFFVLDALFVIQMQARSHISKRFSFLLLLLVLGHEFNHVIKVNALIDNHGNYEVFNHDEDTTPSQDVIKNQDSVEDGKPGEVVSLRSSFFEERGRGVNLPSLSFHEACICLWRSLYWYTKCRGSLVISQSPSFYF